jgi:hypothetical protein
LLRLMRGLRTNLPSDWHVPQSNPSTCADSELESDRAVVRGREEDFWTGHLHTVELVIEVCVTTHDFDRSKLSAYAGAGVNEVWLVPGP